MALSLAALFVRFRRIVSFDEQAGVLRVTGDEDRMTSGRRRRPLSAALRAPRDVIVDLSELRFADPSLMIDLACSPSGCARSGRTLCCATRSRIAQADRARRARPAAGRAVVVAQSPARPSA